MGPVAVLIPAFQPTRQLIDTVRRLAESGAFERTVIVDDGSGPEFEQIFAEAECIARVRRLGHAINLGKGAALRTGINDILCSMTECVGIVTADADGQHATEDIVRIASELRGHAEAVILGCRAFEGKVPFRSRLGNSVTKGLFRLLAGKAITDTQTGLRGLPRRLLPHLLTIPANRYEFELDMLLKAIQLRFEIFEMPIRTLYFDDNRGSHFNPFFDSMRIYFVLTRFSFVALLTAIIDNSVFVVAYRASASIAGSQVLARLVALLFNYFAVRKSVFLSDREHLRTFPRYLALVAASGFASYAILNVLRERFGVPILYAKLMAEGLLFFANFLIQRDVIFRRNESDERLENARD